MGRDLGWLPRPGLLEREGSRESLGRGRELPCARGHDGQHKLGKTTPSQHKACFCVRSDSCRTQSPDQSNRAGARQLGALRGSGCARGPVGFRRRSSRTPQLDNPPGQPNAVGARCRDRVRCRDAPLTRWGRWRWRCPDSAGGQTRGGRADGIWRSWTAVRSAWLSKVGESCNNCYCPTSDPSLRRQKIGEFRRDFSKTNWSNLTSHFEDLKLKPLGHARVD